MICPICKKGETSVVDSRPTEDGTAIRRRRLCSCNERFTTFERVQFRELIVAKDNEVPNIVEKISLTAKTGKIGDGKIFVVPVDSALRIRTDETGEDAI